MWQTKLWYQHVRSCDTNSSDLLELVTNLSKDVYKIKCTTRVHNMPIWNYIHIQSHKLRQLFTIQNNATVICFLVTTHLTQRKLHQLSLMILGLTSSKIWPGHDLSMHSHIFPGHHSALLLGHDTPPLRCIKWPGVIVLGLTLWKIWPRHWKNLANS